jgi:hypothetical protein
MDERLNEHRMPLQPAMRGSESPREVHLIVRRVNGQ